MKVLLVGESWTVHEQHLKGFNLFNSVRYEDYCGRDLARVFESEGISCDYMPSHAAQNEFPYTGDELREYDAIILSDVGSDTFLLPPAVFSGGERRPNRLQTVADYVRNGGGLAMIGGYMSYCGFGGNARYGMTPLAEVLPVTILNYDDRVECPQGIIPGVRDTSHPILHGIDDAAWPFFLGYNRVQVKPGAAEILTADEDTFLAAWETGTGRSVAFASDCAPHWGSSAFVGWKYYGTFFGNIVRWLAKAL